MHRDVKKIRQQLGRSCVAGPATLHEQDGDVIAMLRQRLNQLLGKGFGYPSWRQLPHHGIVAT